LVADVVGDMAYAVGYDRVNASIDDRPVEPITVRSTHVYRRETGEWKIVHRPMATTHRRTHVQKETDNG
jgi:ketosteroid isomerase-like protein